MQDDINKNTQQQTDTEKQESEGLLLHLLTISRRMAEMRSIAPLLTYVVDQVILLVGAERGYIVLLNEDDSFIFKVRRRADGTDIHSSVDSISRSVLDEVINKKESIVVRNAQLDPRFGQAQSVLMMQLRSIMCTPLISKNRIIGAIYVENRSKSGRFSKDNLAPLEFFGNQAAVAIENAYLNDNLEAKVEERTRDLTEAKEAAEAATRTKSAFLSNMSHELRTPMNGVLGMTTLLSDTPLDEEQKDIVNTIRKSGDTLLTLINDILDFSKIEAGKLELEQVSFRLEHCVEEAIDLVTPLASNKGLHLAYVIDEDVPLTLTQDVTRVRQILTNLLSNGVKFTEKGSVTVHISCEKRSTDLPADQYVSNLEDIVFAVSDSGIGIPANRMDRLFQPFTQVDSSTSRKFGGTGLGLIICKRLCELMGGEIKVESEPNKGATFTFSIKATRVHNHVDPNDYANFNALSDKKILLITPDNLVHQSIRQHTQRYQIKLDVTDTVSVVPESTEDYDVIIIDSFSISESDLTGLDSLKIKKPILFLNKWGARTAPLLKEYPASSVSVPIKKRPLLRSLVKLAIGQPAGIHAENPTDIFDSEMASNYPLKILLADDNIINQKVATRILDRCGYQADVVGNGIEAVHACQQIQYDVVLMDILMPELDGIHSTRRIRAELPETHQPYIIAMTADVLDDRQETYFAAGMNGYISKPIKVKTLLNALKSGATQRKQESKAS